MKIVKRDLKHLFFVNGRFDTSYRTPLGIWIK